MATPTPAPPPRPVPILLMVHACLGGTLATIGWGFVLLGLLVAGGLSLGSETATPIALSQGAWLQETTLTSVEQTLFNTGGDEDTEGEPVFAYAFSYEHDGQSYADTSYGPGSIAAEGDTVTIEVAVSDPDKARILGMKASPFGPWVLLAFLAPLTGVPFVAWSFRRGLMANHLLAHGLVTTGRLVEKNATSSHVNNRQVHAYVFEFQDHQDRRRRVSLRTSLAWRVEDDVDEPVVFDPGDPDRAMMIDALPGHPSITPNGSFTVEQPLGAALSVLLPALTFLAAGGTALALFQ